MKQLRVVFVLGARPQIIKSSVLIRMLSLDKQVRLSLIHTGQHYDYGMTKIFFEDLGLPEPSVNLGVGSSSHAQQTAKIMSRLEPLLINSKPDVVLVPGDTNSTLAGALTAAKLGIPVAHLEAGARSHNAKMPEEINRRLTDHCSTLLFTTTETCYRNLLIEGISEEKIRNVGDMMYDVLLHNLPAARKTTILKKLGIISKAYFLLTLHRQENVDSPENLKKILHAIKKLSQFTIVFPVHPRTRSRLCSLNLLDEVKNEKNILLTEPVGYLENLSLIKNARIVLTDSGGMQKEAYWLKTPCLTLREESEWMETVSSGANFVLGSDTERIVKKAREIVEHKKEFDKKMKTLPNPFGDGKASQRTLAEIKKAFLSP